MFDCNSIWRLQKSLFPKKSCPQYDPRPGKPGKIYWISGPPGAGKSTTCQILAQKYGFVYYEVDNAFGNYNPFPDLQKELSFTSAKAIKV